MFPVMTKKGVKIKKSSLDIVKTTYFFRLITQWDKENFIEICSVLQLSLFKRPLYGDF